jgi:hypothetical protein
MLVACLEVDRIDRETAKRFFIHLQQTAKHFIGYVICNVHLQYEVCDSNQMFYTDLTLFATAAVEPSIHYTPHHTTPHIQAR